MNRDILTIGLSDEFYTHFDAVFSKEQRQVFACRSITRAKEAISKETFCFILVNMPNLPQQAIVDAVQTLRQLSYAQMLVLASDEAVEDVLRAGADNCLPLETSAERAVEHARAMIRRYTLYNHYDLAKPDASVIYRGELMIDPLRRHVTMAGEEIALQRREFKLLQHFAENPGIVLTADQIGELLWGAEYDYNRKLSPVIAELRRKIHDTSRPPNYIETVHGVGYRFLPNK